MSVKCQVCKQNEAVWAMQYVASDVPSFTRLGSHYRGFHVTKVCDACREEYKHPHTFLICPVRGHDRTETEEIVARLEGEGWKVHWPPRDTRQDGDATGLRICLDNRRAITQAQHVHVIWDGKSEGCLFDLGMAFALGKTIHVISLPDATEGKSFQNMIRAWEAPF